MVTKMGIINRNELAAYRNVRKVGLIASTGRSGRNGLGKAERRYRMS
jgi:hypothetical protein